MSAESAMRAGRAAAERKMLDTCTIRAVTSNTTGPGGVVTPAYGPPVYEGKCGLQNFRSFPSTPDAGDRKWTVTPTTLHLPVDGTEAVTTNQIVDILTSVDPANVGRRFRVRADDRKSLQTALRVMVEEVMN